MIRSFLSLILVTIFSLFSLHSIAYANELKDNKRIIDNHLLPCSTDVACVVSLEEDSQSYIPPITYHIDRNQAKEILLKVLPIVPRTEVIETKDNYILAEAKGKFFGGVDDLEFYFPSDISVIELRSASRKSKFDLGVNRRRLEQIRLALKDLNI